MDPTPLTQPSPNPDASAYFVWEPAGKNFTIHLNGDVVDQINLEVMRGFGAVPRRGAEVGGLLLGTVERGAKPVVRIEEFVNVPCEHLHGPSYVLSGADLVAFDRQFTTLLEEGNGSSRVVGFFRSNTREPMQLSEVDLALLDARSPDEDAVCLLVKPFATRPSEAVFLIREEGRFSGAVQRDTFIFRRKEMHLPTAPKRERGAPNPDPGPTPPADAVTRKEQRLGAENPPEIPAPIPATAKAKVADIDFVRLGRRRIRRDPRPEAVAGQAGGSVAQLEAHGRPSPAGPNAEHPIRDLAQAPELPWDLHPAPVKRSSWAWAPLSFIFLLLGILIGAGITLMMDRARIVKPSADPYAMTLGLTHFGDSFHLSWNPRMPALRQARGGELVIEEHEATKTQPLSADDLARGGIIYRGVSEPVRFRLTVFLSDRAALIETVESQAAPQ